MNRAIVLDKVVSGISLLVLKSFNTWREIFVSSRSQVIYSLNSFGLLLFYLVSRNIPY